MTFTSLADEQARETLATHRLATPCPIIDQDILMANLRGMAEAVSHSGCGLRPHFKTHRAIEIASQQMKLGACGLTCATICEAEVLVKNGFDDILIAYPLWADKSTGRRMQTLSEMARLRIGVDSVESVERIAEITRGGPTQELIIEIDPGFQRSGVKSNEVLRIASAIVDHGLIVSGVFAYPGQAYDAPEAVATAVQDELRTLAEAREILEEAGIAPSVVSAGSTPTARLSAGESVTDVRPGVYVFNDRQQVLLGTCRESEVALVVLATVVSTSVRGSFVVDAGSKALSSDRLPWIPGFGSVLGAPDVIAHSLSEHHGVFKLPDGVTTPHIGEVVAIVPNHVCNVVHQFANLAAIDGDGACAHWPVTARLS
ncbi:MAG: alanine racemase [Solirubrobacteraceae bacterium]